MDTRVKGKGQPSNRREQGTAVSAQPVPTLRTLTERIRQALAVRRAPRAGGAALPRPTFESFEPRVLLAADPVVPRVDGNLDVAGEVDRYSFTVAQDVRIVFDSLTSNGNMRWTLQGPAGNLVDDRGFTNSDSYDVGGDVAMNLRPGDYTLSVRGVGDTTGAYAFRLLNLANATPLTLGQQASGRLDPGNETDAFSFAATAGQSVYLDMQAMSGGDASWRLIDPFGRNLGNVRSLGDDLGRVELPYDGNYTLLVEGRTWQSTPIDYRFQLHAVQDAKEQPLVPGEPQGMEARRIAVDTGSALQLNGLQQVRADVDPSLDLRRTVTMEAWVRVDRFDATWTPLIHKGTGAIGERTYSLWLRNDGAVHLSTFDGSEQVATTQGGLIDTGTWHHIAAVIDRNAGSMRVLVDGVESASSDVRSGDAIDSSAQPLTLGYPVEDDSSYGGLVGAVHDVRVWSVARSNEDIVATMAAALDGTQAGLVLNLRFAEEDGNTLINTVAAAGAPQASLVAAVEGAVARRFEAPGQVVEYRFTLANAQRLYFDSLSGNGNLRWSLSGPRGEVVTDRRFDSSDADQGPGVLALPAGDYTLRVRSVNDGAQDFAFRLLPLSEASVVALDTEVEAVLGTSRQTQAFQFQAREGERFFFDSLGRSGTDFVWRLIDPLGRLIFGPTAFWQDVQTSELGVAGVYTLLLEGRSWASGTSRGTFAVRKVVDEERALSPGGRMSGGLFMPGQKQRFTLHVERSGTFVLDGIGADSGAFRWRVDSAAGTVMAPRSLRDDGPQVLNLAPGDYVLTIDGDGDTAGRFDFVLLDLAEATALDAQGKGFANLDQGTQLQRYAFDAQAGDLVRFTPLSTTGVAPNWWLIDPSGRPVFGPAGFYTQDLTLQATGRYVLLTDGPSYATDPATYAFQLVTQGNTPPEPLTGQAIDLGGTVTGNLASPGDVRDFVFTIDAPVRLLFDGLSQNGAFRWQLDGPRGQESPSRDFGSSDSYYAGAEEGLALVLPGTYRVRVSGSGATGDFAFRLLDVAQAQSLTLGDSVTATLAPANATALYAFDAAAGDRLFFDAQNGTVGAYWRLFDPLGHVVRAYGYTYYDTGDIALTATGRYTLAIEGYYAEGGASGSVQFALHAARDQTAALVPGQRVDGRIAAPGERRIYEFSLDGEHQMYLDALAGSGLRWRLLSGTGEVLTDQNFDYGDGYYGPGVFDLPAGDYRLVVDGGGGAGTGDFAFRLLDLASAQSVVPGTAYSGQRDPASGAVLLAFDAQAGQRFYFDAQAGDYNDNWRLVDPYGRTVWGPTDLRNDVDVTTLALAGRYTLIVDGYSSQTGTAAFGFNVLPVADDTATVGLGEAVAGRIEQLGERDIYTIEITADTLAYFDSRTNDGSLRWSLKGPRGDVVGSTGFNGSDWYYGPGVMSLAAGTYTLTVDGSGAAIGDYRFRLMDLAQAGELQSGVAVDGSRSPGAAAQAWRFDAQAGDRLFLDLLTNSDGNTTWRLIDPYGNTVW
uniref:LamG domain-containing protein n=1 Tax=uncultured Pseudacidovorax sp. TaxID=679313 RepID=UPI0025DBB667